MARAPAVVGAAVPFLIGMHHRALNPAVKSSSIRLAHPEVAHAANARAVATARSRRTSVVADAIDWMVEVAEAGALGWHGPGADGERHKTQKQRKQLRKMRNSAAGRE
jgi:hypothetical protein